MQGMKARAKANVMWALGTLGEAEECGVMDHCTDIIAHVSRKRQHGDDLMKMEHNISSKHPARMGSFSILKDYYLADASLD